MSSLTQPETPQPKNSQPQPFIERITSEEKTERKNNTQQQPSIDPATNEEKKKKVPIVVYSGLHDPKNCDGCMAGVFRHREYYNLSSLQVSAVNTPLGFASDTTVFGLTGRRTLVQDISDDRDEVCLTLDCCDTSEDRYLYTIRRTGEESLIEDVQDIIYAPEIDKKGKKHDGVEVFIRLYPKTTVNFFGSDEGEDNRNTKEAITNKWYYIGFDENGRIEEEAVASYDAYSMLGQLHTSGTTIAALPHSILLFVGGGNSRPGGVVDTLTGEGSKATRWFTAKWEESQLKLLNTGALPQNEKMNVENDKMNEESSNGLGCARGAWCHAIFTKNRIYIAGSAPGGAELRLWRIDTPKDTAAAKRGEFTLECMSLSMLDFSRMHKFIGARDNTFRVVSVSVGAYEDVFIVTLKSERVGGQRVFVVDLKATVVGSLCGLPSYTLPQDIQGIHIFYATTGCADFVMYSRQNGRLFRRDTLLVPDIEWDAERVIWIGHFKNNQNSLCYFGHPKFAKELVKKILSYCRIVGAPQVVYLPIMARYPPELFEKQNVIAAPATTTTTESRRSYSSELSTNGTHFDDTENDTENDIEDGIEGDIEDVVEDVVEDDVTAASATQPNE